MAPARWALITGCSTGIGRNLIASLRSRGWGVVATARKLETLQGIPPGEGLRCVALDVLDESSIQAAVSVCSDLPLVAVVNNAGYGQVGPLEMLTTDELRRQFDTNVFGLHSVTRAFLPLIRAKAARGEGRVVQVASMLGRLSIPLAGPYNASKHAVIALAESLRLEIGDEIPVIVVEPGAIRTEFRETLTKVWGDLPERAKGSRFEPILRDYMEKRKEMSQKWAGDPIACAEKIARAMSASRPPRRVVIGLDSYWAGKVKALLPAFLWERMLRRAYGIR